MVVSMENVVAAGVASPTLAVMNRAAALMASGVDVVEHRSTQGANTTITL